MEQTNSIPPSDFIRDIINEDMKTGKHQGRVATRFPPEPNGYPHIGHAKSVCLNFGIASQYGGTCNLRLDDTDPSGESVEYVESIIRDVKWLGFDWQDRLYYASDYYDKLYDFALQLIRIGKAYVCDLSADEIREYRGTLTQPGKESPYRSRSVEENLSLLERMRAGEFDEGTHVLRAKIDMNSPNVTMRDPIMYRIKKVSHYRTGDSWCIYPMYDFAHCLSDSIEGITHSICTLEFENNRPLYDWFLKELNIDPRPGQIEFARLNLSYSVLSKRKLIELVEKGVVEAREIECSVLGNQEIKASLPGEIIPSNEFYDYDAKYVDGKSDAKIPADLTPDMVKTVQETAIRAFRALSGEGLARVDFFLTPDNKLYVNEVNTMPGFTSISMYPKLWEATGLGYSALLDELINLALARSKEKQSLKISYEPKAAWYATF